MTWILTTTGAQFDLRLADPKSISILDIAHSLALINRFNGHVTRPYSVAEHSLHVCHVMEREHRIDDPHALLAGLLHDAHEAYVGDMATPLKTALGAAWFELEGRVQQQVQQRFGVAAASRAWSAAIKRADVVMLATERRDLLPAAGPPWPMLQGVACSDDIDLDFYEGLGWKDWRDIFLERFAELREAIKEQRADARGDLTAGA